MTKQQLFFLLTVSLLLAGFAASQTDDPYYMRHGEPIPQDRRLQ